MSMKPAAMRIFALAASLAAAFAAVAPAHAKPRSRRPQPPKSAVASKATGGKGVLVLQVGSDWCVSGEAVRKAFESREFRRAFGMKFVMAVHDEMENPTPAARAANAEIGPLLVRTKRFPALTCYASDGEGLHFFAQVENIPMAADGERLAKAVAKVVAKKNQAVKLFEKGRGLASRDAKAAADAYGEGFDILASMAGPFHFRELTTGDWAWKGAWKALEELDAGDRFGWLKHFEMDDLRCVEMVASVTAARATGSARSAQSVVDEINRIPHDHFSANQRQCVKVMEYALTYRGVDAPLTEGERRLMEEAYEMGRDTFWGQYAMGRLMLDGKDIKSKGLPRAKVRPRPDAPAADPPPFPLETVRAAVGSILPKDELGEAQKLAVARYAALRLVGEEAWRDVGSRPGGAAFLKALFNDRAWLEDFAWSGSFPENSRDADCRSQSGPGAAAGALRALEELAFQDGGRWVPVAGGRYADNEGRRFMTALAIGYPDREVEWLADMLDAYRASARAGRLHKSAYSQPVWLWRFAVQQGLRTNYLDGNSAAQHRQLDRFLNQPTFNGGGDTTGLMRYHLSNCFGEECNTRPYYLPWRTAGEWPMSRYVQIVGGVCAQISTYGSAVANAHGMPSSTVDEPVHLSYTRRMLDGAWRLNYTVTGHSRTRLAFWNRRPWQYTTALEHTFTGDRESRLATDRLLELAHVAEERGARSDVVEAYYRRACNLWPQHYRAWYEYGDWVSRTEVPLDTMRTWLKGCARGMKTGSRPLWDFLTPFFGRAASERGAKGLAEELVHFAPLLRQGEERLQQEADFDVALEEWCAPLGNDESLAYDVLKAMLAAQWGTRDCFAQTLAWGSKYFLAKGGTETLVRCIGESIPSGAMKKGGGGIDLGPTILSASNSGNIEAFKTLTRLQGRLAPSSGKGAKYPGKDFGGSLIGCDGLVKMPGFANNDNAKRLGRVIDDSPAGEGFIHKDKAPWVQVTLEGPSLVKGVVFAKARGHLVKPQFPLFVDVSEDGEKWTRVRVVEEPSDTVRVDLHSDAPRARHVRIGRVENAKDEFFSVAKVLVYGQKLY